ncbi:hypothetical protein [Novosphingobium mathurense]|uniref:Uncharacterized protein n=1 Tax=Novosphingobium mathurense TaxID=428990 RepID=A0A1U6IT98_9SPHN|nr:hypothetical protein [Novosphingobium mathurense]SLK11228.1 hypothetical protein SAMN06295987_1144 [Novosphingobium mathurense]
MTHEAAAFCQPIDHDAHAPVAGFARRSGEDFGIDACGKNGAGWRSGGH